MRYIFYLLVQINNTIIVPVCLMANKKIFYLFSISYHKKIKKMKDQFVVGSRLSWRCKNPIRELVTPLSPKVPKSSPIPILRVADHAVGAVRAALRARQDWQKCAPHSKTESERICICGLVLIQVFESLVI